MNLNAFDELLERWRGHAGLYRFHGQEALAVMVEAFVFELQETITQWRLECLTLEAAADESGYTYSTLQQRVAKGEIPNAGESGRPRIRRCDLPYRAGRSHLKLASGEPDLAAEIATRKLAS